ncbi:hypothetical protein [Candidatus Thiodiazotropha sp. CDECU1]|uniref:hypothetical protein n=1 Tax=Candidatus Thiodiazotropha sp. CDECU1 TaxID=3065865 RepID=UPI002930C3EF|nr:hypothetical protein [Candidatus Thiodiazotropha sp. CDECU1]
MSNDQVEKSLLESVREWICDNYSVRVRFIAEVDVEGFRLWEAAIGFTPLLLKEDNSFSIKSEKILVGQIDLNLATKQNCLDIFEKAMRGVIDTPDGVVTLATETGYSCYSETSHRDRWYYDLHLSVRGSVNNPVSGHDLAQIDNILRLSTPPFDGIYDAATWLGLGGAIQGHNNSVIELRISPPVDLFFEKCALVDDTFSLALHALPGFDTSLLHVAVRGAPGDNLKTRLQIASEIIWEQREDNLVLGTASVELSNSDSVIVMLMIGNSIVRRQWFLDPSKARNNRLLAVQSFDSELKMIKNAVLETPDSSRFENGIAALLFILGFSPCVQLETDSPDLIVQTPNGRLILIECTLRIADFSAKVGKLVDRRGKLIKELEKSGHSSSIATVLVCRLPRDQIAAHAEDLASYKTILITHKQLKNAFDQVRYHNDPDSILDEAESALNDDNQMTLGLES